MDDLGVPPILGNLHILSSTKCHIARIKDDMGSAMATWSVMPILQSLRNSWDSQWSPCLTSHIFWVWKTISDFGRCVYFSWNCLKSGILSVSPDIFFSVCFVFISTVSSMSSHDPLQRFFRRLLPGALVMVMFTTAPAGTIPPWLAPWKCQQKLWKIASFSMIRIEHGDFPWLHQKKSCEKNP